MPDLSVNYSESVPSYGSVYCGSVNVEPPTGFIGIILKRIQSYFEILRHTPYCL